MVIGIDGLSNFIVRAAIMPRKNNIVIYEHIFASAVAEFGLWDQLIADSGREFFLSEFIQEYLKTLRIKPDGTLSQRDPYRQLPSPQVCELMNIFEPFLLP